MSCPFQELQDCGEKMVVVSESFLVPHNPNGYTPGSTNSSLAGKWGPWIESIRMGPIEDGDIPSSYVRKYQRVNHQGNPSWAPPKATFTPKK